MKVMCFTSLITTVFIKIGLDCLPLEGTSKGELYGHFLMLLLSLQSTEGLRTFCNLVKVIESILPTILNYRRLCPYKTECQRAYC